MEIKKKHNQVIISKEEPKLEENKQLYPKSDWTCEEHHERAKSWEQLQTICFNWPELLDNRRVHFVIAYGYGSSK